MHLTRPRFADQKIPNRSAPFTSLVAFITHTPWKINMEPTINHPFRKENDLPNLHD